MAIINFNLPCKHCGSYERYTKSDGSPGGCVVCVRAYRRRRYQERKIAEVVQDNARRCTSCGILLDHPATVDCGDKCGDCCGKVARFRDVVPAGHEPVASRWGW